MSPIPSGTRLGHFEVVAPLGAGGQGWVYRARDTELRRDVAVKVLAGRDDDPDTRAGLLREARRAAQLNHPGICQVFHVGDSVHGPFMVMELVDGQTLAAAIEAGPLPLERACRIGREIASALDHAHAHGIVHRDLKCANVMLTPDGRVKVLDFGIAAVLPGTDLVHTATATAAGAGGDGRIAGTLPYMAPEVLRGEAASISSDIWALGVVLYEMTTGRRPFDRRAPSDLAAAILRDPPAPISHDVPPTLTHLVGRCLSKDAAERPARAGEVALALEIASMATPPTPAVAPVPAPAPPTPTRRWVAAAGGGAAIVAIAWFGLRSSPAPSDSGDRPLRLERATQLTGAAGVEEHPAWSPDGRTVAYSASGSGFWGFDWDIFVTQPGSTPVNRTEDHGDRDMFPAWSPDGTQLAFWSARDGGGCYVMPAVAGSARRIADASVLDPNAPIWSADGAELSCVVGDARDVSLVTFAVATGEAGRRIALPADGRRMFVAPAPDWRHVAMVVSPGGLASDLTRLVMLDVAAGTTALLTDGQTNVWSPVWSPDGTALFYVSNAGGSADIWRQALDAAGGAAGPPAAVSSGIGVRNLTLTRDGARVAYAQGRKIANLWRVPILAGRTATWADATQITADQAFVEFADLSANGDQLAISSDRSGNFDLWVLPAAGGAMRQVTSDPGAEFAPRWSPDGQRFAFYSLRSGNRDIWTMPVAGGQWTQVTTSPGADLLPDWSPDGREIVHLSNRGTHTAVWVTPAGGGEGREIVSSSSGGRYSPDGKLIAFLLGGRLAVRSATGQGEIVTLTNGAAFNGTWAPDGSRLYFAGGGERLGNLYSVSPDGSGDRAVTNLANRRGTIVTNSLATDGTYLYFSWQEDLSDLWIAELTR